LWLIRATRGCSLLFCVGAEYELCCHISEVAFLMLLGVVRSEELLDRKRLEFCQICQFKLSTL